MKHGKIISTGLAWALFASVTIAGAQTVQPLKLDECYALARKNYPLVHQQDLIEQSKQYSISNIAKGNYPQVGIFGQASYQSAVTEVPVKIPGNEIVPPDKDQYKIYGEISQVVYDGGTIRQQKKSQEVNSLIESHKLEVELYQLRERVNQLFFGILMLDEQLEQIAILEKDLKAGVDRTSAAIQNGVALKSSLDVINAEILKTRQRKIELESARWSFVLMLARFINQAPAENIQLVKPESVAVTSEIRRPELAMFEAQNKGLEVREDLLKSKNRPRFNLFFQGGYGRPALNMLSNEFDLYYIGGLRMQWNLLNWYTIGKEKKLVDISRQSNQIQKETFLFNTHMAVTQQNEEIVKLMKLLETDDEIIVLRDNIKNTSSAQLENGVITSNDFVREVNAADLARQNKILHEVQLLMAQYNHQTITGN